jgi:hypothetical protein
MAEMVSNETEPTVQRQISDTTNQQSNKEDGKKEWAVIVTTAPRKECTLLECTDSIVDAGWEPIIIAEPDSTPTEYATFCLRS